VNEQGVERSKLNLKQFEGIFALTQGELLEWTSIRIFFRVQWEPFEASFGTIDSSLRHHLEVLLHSAQALQLRDADSERRRVRQKESRKRILTSFALAIYQAYSFKCR
jgi:hypothetical protein